MRALRLGPWLLAIAALACFETRAHAVQPLEAFLAGAKTHSFDAREAAATSAQRSGEADASLGKLLPTFTARGTYQYNFRETTIPPFGELTGAVPPGSGEPTVITPHHQLDASLLLEVPIIDLASYHRYQAAKAVLRSAEEQRGATGIDIARNVARSYYQYLGSIGVVRSARQSIEAAEANLKQVEDRRSAGAATDLDRERAAASVSRARQDLADAELGIALSARALETLSGLRPGDADGIPEDDLRPEATLDDWLRRAGETPQQRVARQLEEAAEHNRKAASRAYLPTLSAAAEQRFSNATGFGGHVDNTAVRAILSWRLDYGVVGTDRAQAAALEVQKVRVERTKRAALDAVFEAWKRVEAGLVKSSAARAQERSAQRAAELSSDRYGAGVATQLDVTQAQRDAYLASAARVQADADLAYARAALRLAAGVPTSDRRAP